MAGSMKENPVLRRLRGLMIILRVLAPFLLVAGLAVATWWMAEFGTLPYSDLESMRSGPRWMKPTTASRRSAGSSW